MAAQDYSRGGDTNAADPRQPAQPAPRAQPRPREPAPAPEHLPLAAGAALLEPPRAAFADNAALPLPGTLPGTLPGMLPPPHLLAAEGLPGNPGSPTTSSAAAGPEDFGWAPQHARTHSAYAPLPHHRQAPSFYQPPLPAHIREQSASDFYFLRSPHASPGLSQEPFDALGLDAGGARAPFRSDAPRPRHARGSSVSKAGPARSHRRTRTLGSQADLPFAAAPGFPGPLVAPRPGPGPASHLRGASRTHGMPAAASSAAPTAPLEPAAPAPLLVSTSMGAAAYALRGDAGSPGPPAWQEPAPRTRSEPSASQEKKPRPRGRRHARRRTRDSSSSSAAAPAVLTATNPMSDYAYTSQYHGLGIGLGAPPPPPPGPPQASTPLFGSPQMGSGSGFAPGPPAFAADVPPVPPPPLRAGSALPAQFGYGDRPGYESTPVLGGMPFLPPYVSYEQQLQMQQQHEHEHVHEQAHEHDVHEHEHAHEHEHEQHAYVPPLPSQWRDDEPWQHDYWGAPRPERPPVAGPSTAPRRGEAYAPADLPFPTHASAPLANPPRGTAPAASLLPSIASLRAEPPEPDALALDVPGPDYDESAHMDWSLEDMEELMRLLEPAEKHKWRYMSDLLTETRKKRIPLRTCQNKFHALFGETESSSKLRSSLFYVAYRSGWDSIRESSTMREREAETAQQQQQQQQQSETHAGSDETANQPRDDAAAAAARDDSTPENTTKGGARK